jgi:hypothetical protein
LLVARPFVVSGYKTQSWTPRWAISMMRLATTSRMARE